MSGPRNPQKQNIWSAQEKDPQKTNHLSQAKWKISTVALPLLKSCDLVVDGTPF
jgi:hypothetical protein